MAKKRRTAIPSETRKQLQGAGCAKCMGADDVQIHHIHAVMDGGGNEDSNLLPLCYRCHKEWHFVESTSPIQFSEWVKLPPYHLMARLWQRDKNMDAFWQIFLGDMRKSQLELEAQP